MPAKSKNIDKAEKEAASFEKFKAVFLEEFLWSGDKTVKVDEAKLAKLFERCFKAKNYPTLNELRETVSFLATFTDKGVKYEHAVHYLRNFEEVADFFEENLEGSFKAGLDAFRKESRSSKPAHSIKAQKKEKPLPDDRKELPREYQTIQKRIAQLKNKQRELDKKRARILKPFPRLKVVWEDERTGKLSGKPVEGAKKVGVYFPRSHWVETHWKLRTQAMTEGEKIAQKAARKLSLDDIIKGLEIEKAEQRLSLIEAKAEIDGVTLPERKKTPKSSRPRSEVGSPTRRKRAVPENMARRRALVKAFYNANPTTRGNNLDELTCSYLDQCKVGVRSKWREKYKIKTWAEAYNHPKLKDLIHKMFSVDRKRG